jgi:hypothetical protein
MKRKKDNTTKKEVYKYTENNLTYYVIFKFFDNKVVKCFIYDPFLKRTFSGKASCNIQEGDVFSKEKGKEIAYIRADDKRLKKHEKIKFALDMEFGKHMAINIVFDKKIFGRVLNEPLKF